MKNPRRRGARYTRDALPRRGAGVALVALARSNARNSGRVLGVPMSHLLVAPCPLERVGVVAVVLRGGGQHVLDELLPAVPRPPFEVAAAERPDQQLRLVQPRGVGGREAGPPPAAAVVEVALGVAGRVAGVAVVDQERAAQVPVPPAERP